MPNAGSWITSRDAADYSAADGVITGTQKAELNRLLLADPAVRALRGLGELVVVAPREQQSSSGRAFYWRERPAQKKTIHIGRSQVPAITSPGRARSARSCAA